MRFSYEGMMVKKKDIETIGAAGAAVGANVAIRLLLEQKDVDDNALIALGQAATTYFVGRKIKRSLGEFMHSIGAVIGSDRLIAAAETVHGEEVIAMLFNSAMDTPDPAAKPAIIALGAEYMDHRTSIDKFIRAAMRMLVACDAEDIETLARIFAVATHNATGAYVKLLRHAPKRSSVSIYADSSAGSTVPKGPAKTLDNIDADRAFYLIGGNGLGRATTFNKSSTLTINGVSNGPDGVVMTSDFVLRLAKVVGARG